MFWLFILGFVVGWFYCSLMAMGAKTDRELEICWLRQELTELQNSIDSHHEGDPT